MARASCAHSTHLPHPPYVPLTFNFKIVQGPSPSVCGAPARGTNRCSALAAGGLGRKGGAKPPPSTGRPAKEGQSPFLQPTNFVNSNPPAHPPPTHRPHLQYRRAQGPSKIAVPGVTWAWREGGRGGYRPIAVSVLLYALGACHRGGDHHAPPPMVQGSL